MLSILQERVNLEFWIKETQEDSEEPLWKLKNYSSENPIGNDNNKNPIKYLKKK